MFGTACPECQTYYASIGRIDGPCRPGCTTELNRKRAAEIAHVLGVPHIQCTPVDKETIQAEKEKAP